MAQIPFAYKYTLTAKKQITIPVWCNPSFFDIRTKRIKYTHPDSQQLALQD